MWNSSAPAEVSAESCAAGAPLTAKLAPGSVSNAALSDKFPTCTCDALYLPRSKFSPPPASSHIHLFGGILWPLFRAGHNAGAEIVRDRYDFAHVCP